MTEGALYDLIYLLYPRSYDPTLLMGYYTHLVIHLGADIPFFFLFDLVLDDGKVLDGGKVLDPPNRIIVLDMQTDDLIG